MVKEHGANIVQVAIQGEKTTSCLVRPDLDFVIVSSGNEERLCFVKVNASDRTIVLFEAVDQGSHSIVP